MKNLADQVVDQKLARKLFDDEFHNRRGILYFGGIRISDKIIGFVCKYDGIDGDFFYIYKLDGEEYKYVVAPLLSRFLAYPDEYITEIFNLQVKLWTKK